MSGMGRRIAAVGLGLAPTPGAVRAAEPSRAEPTVAIAVAVEG